MARSVSHAFCFSVTFWKEAGRERWVQAAGLGGAWGSSLPVTLTSPPPPASRPLDPQVTRSPGDSGMGTALSTGSSLPAGGGLGPRRQPWPQGPTGSWSVSACSSASPRESVSVCSHAHMHSSTCASVHAPMHASVHSSEPLGAKQRPAPAWCLSERSSFCVVTGTKGLWAWQLCWAPAGGQPGRAPASPIPGRAEGLLDHPAPHRAVGTTWGSGSGAWGALTGRLRWAAPTPPSLEHPGAGEGQAPRHPITELRVPGAQALAGSLTMSLVIFESSARGRPHQVSVSSSAGEDRGCTGPRETRGGAPGHPVWPERPAHSSSGPSP